MRSNFAYYSARSILRHLIDQLDKMRVRHVTSGVLPETVVIELVVARHCDESAGAGSESVEDLNGSVAPHLPGEEAGGPLNYTLVYF